MLQVVIGQSQLFKKYSVEEGLPFVKVNAIYQDSKGYIWSGGYGGLSKFDGYEFISYGQKDGLTNNSITCISESKEHQLYIGSLNGVTLIKDETFEHYSLNTKLPSSNVKSITSIDSILFVGTNSGLFIDFGDTHQIELKGEEIHCIIGVSFGVLIGTAKSVFLWKNGKIESYKSNLFGQVVNTIFEDENKDLYFGTAEGLLMIDRNGRVKKYQTLDGLWGKNVMAIGRKSEEQLWVGTETALQQFDGEKFNLITIDNHPYSYSITTLFKDFEGLLWIGTAFGMYKSVGSVFRHYTFKDGFLGRFIYQVTRDQDDNLWIATDDKGAWRYNGSDFQTYNKFFGLSGNSVKSIVTKGDTTYFGTDEGLTIKIGDNFKIVDEFEGLGGKQIYTLKLDQDNDLWMGLEGGVVKFHNQITTIYELPTSELSQFWAITQDSKGDIWAGGYQGGVFKLSGDKFVRMNDSLSITDDNCLAIHEDYKGNLWFATFTGVFLYNRRTNQVSNISVLEGLSSNLVYSFVEEDNHPYLWMGTNQGLNRIDLENFYKTEETNIVQYGFDDGFVGVECNCNGAYLDNDGSLWFGTVNGLIKYNPLERNEKGIPSKTHITGVKIFYQDTLLESGAQLPYENNHLTFSYEGICHSNPNKVRYKFRLLGYRQEWSPVSKERQTTYSNLPPGEYKFQVISSNNEGVWNQTAEEFSFSIERPIYLKWWFLLIVAASAFLIIYGSFKYRIQRLEQKNELLRKMDNLKLQALRSQMNPHFIFNSLNSIQHYINSNEKREANIYLSKFAQLMRNILDNSRKPLVSIQNDLMGVELYMELEQIRFEGKFEFKIELDDEIDPYEDEVPPMLLQPFVENSIIHGFKGLSKKGLITIHIGLIENYVSYKITDNGIGRAAAEKSKSKRANQLHESAAMNITQARIDTLGQYYRDDLKISIDDLMDSEKNALGTSVTILIPHDNNPKNRMI